MNGIKKLNVHAQTNFYSLKRADPDDTLSSFPTGFLSILYFNLVMINLRSRNREKIYIIIFK